MTNLYLQIRTRLPLLQFCSNLVPNHAIYVPRSLPTVSIDMDEPSLHSLKLLRTILPNQIYSPPSSYFKNLRQKLERRSYRRFFDHQLWLNGLRSKFWCTLCHLCHLKCTLIFLYKLDCLNLKKYNSLFKNQSCIINIYLTRKQS